MLLGHRIIFPFDHLFRHGAGILLCDIEITRVSGADQTDFDCCCLGHFDFSVSWGPKMTGKPRGLRVSGIRAEDVLSIQLSRKPVSKRQTTQSWPIVKSSLGFIDVNLVQGAGNCQFRDAFEGDQISVRTIVLPFM